MTDLLLPALSWYVKMGTQYQDFLDTERPYGVSDEMLESLPVQELTRNDIMRRLRSYGYTFEQIATFGNITRQRVWELAGDVDPGLPLDKEFLIETIRSRSLQNPEAWGHRGMRHDWVMVQLKSLRVVGERAELLSREVTFSKVGIVLRFFKKIPYESHARYLADLLSAGSSNTFVFRDIQEGSPLTFSYNAYRNYVKGLK